MRGYRLKRVAVSALSLAIIGASIATLNPSRAHASGGQAPAGKSLSDGVYTDEQHRRGQSLGKTSCVSCHGEGLAGGDVGPALQGADFLAAWSGRSLGELFEKIQTSMPADAVGTLKPQQSADLVAHILKLNDFPAGSSELGPDMAALNEIKIRAQK
jgi:mono/diheme cytochrome c family protein